MHIYLSYSHAVHVTCMEMKDWGDLTIVLRVFRAVLAML